MTLGTLALFFLDALKVQIQSDIREARAWLAAHGFPAGAPAHADLVST